MFIATMVSGNPESLNYVGNNRSCDHSWLMLWETHSREPDSKSYVFWQSLRFQPHSSYFTSGFGDAWFRVCFTKVTSKIHGTSPGRTSLIRGGSASVGCLCTLQVLNHRKRGLALGSAVSIWTYRFIRTPCFERVLASQTSLFLPQVKKVQTLPFDLYVYSF